MRLRTRLPHGRWAGLRWSSSGSEGRATASSRPPSRSAQRDGVWFASRLGARPTGGLRWSSSGSEGRATASSRPPQLARLGTRDRFGGLDDGLAQGLGLLDQRERSLVEQRERGTSDRVVETSVADTLTLGSSSSRRRDDAASTGAVKGSLRRFAPLTAPAPAGMAPIGTTPTCGRGVFVGRAAGARDERPRRRDLRSVCPTAGSSPGCEWGSRRRPRPGARPARPTGGLCWSSSGSEGRATASSRPRG